MSTPLINGVNYAWANVSIILFGTPVVGVLSIDYKAKQAKDNNYGAGSVPVSRGYGRVEFDANIEMYTDTWKAIIAESPNRDPLQIPFFDIVVTFGGTGVTVDKDVLRACEFMENPFEAKEGDTKLTVKIPLIIAGIDR